MHLQLRKPWSSAGRRNVSTREGGWRGRGTHDGVGDGLELLLLLGVLVGGGLGAGIEPRDGLGDGLVERLLVGSVELVLEVSLNRVSEVVRVRLESVLGGDARGSGLIL